MGRPVAPSMTPWKGELGHAGGGPELGVGAAWCDSWACACGNRLAMIVASATINRQVRAVGFVTPCGRQASTFAGWRGSAALAWLLALVARVAGRRPELDHETGAEDKGSTDPTQGAQPLAKPEIGRGGRKQRLGADDDCSLRGRGVLHGDCQQRKRERAGKEPNEGDVDGGGAHLGKAQRLEGERGQGG